MSDSAELINKINSLIKKNSDEIERFEEEKNTIPNIEQRRHLDDRIKIRKDHIEDLVNNRKKLETFLAKNTNIPDAPLLENEPEIYDALQDDVKNIEKEMEEKGNQQQEALKMREEEYKQKTGKEFNPLVTDELEQPKPNPIVEPEPVTKPPIKPPKPTLNPVQTPVQNPVQKPLQNPVQKPVKNFIQNLYNSKKTRKNRVTLKEIQMKQRGKNFVNEDIPTPDDNYVDLMAPKVKPQILTPKPKLKLRPVNSGFSETIVSKGSATTGPARPNTKICPQILATGKKINTTYFIPSQIPNLTKIKPVIPKEDTKIGGRKSRKRIMIRTRKNKRGRNSRGNKQTKRKK